MSGRPTTCVGTEVQVTLSLDRKKRRVAGQAPQRHLGVVRYVGKAGTTDYWIGVELSQPVGKHNGRAKNNTHYFQCKHNHGVYVRPWHVLPMRRTLPVPSSDASSTFSDEHKFTLEDMIAYLRTSCTVEQLKKIQEACSTQLQAMEKQRDAVKKHRRAYSTQVSRVYTTKGEDGGSLFGGGRVDLVVDEIHKTERAYVQDLTTTIDVFAIPLVQHNIISEEQAQLLFSNIETLRDLNESMLRDLQESTTTHTTTTTTTTNKKSKTKRTSKAVGGDNTTKQKQHQDEIHEAASDNQETVGEVLGRYAPFFKMYNLFITNYHNNVHAILEELESKNSSGSSSSSSSGSSSGSGSGSSGGGSSNGGGGGGGWL